MLFLILFYTHTDKYTQMWEEEFIHIITIKWEQMHWSGQKTTSFGVSLRRASHVGRYLNTQRMLELGEEEKAPVS